MKYGPSKLHFVPATARSRPPHPQTHSQRQINRPHYAPLTTRPGMPNDHRPMTRIYG
jgi:hypothetical protein